MVYGRSNTFDVVRLIDMLQALEKFVAVKDQGDGTAFKVDGMRGETFVGKAGDSKGTKALEALSSKSNGTPLTATSKSITREALKFFFSDEGKVFRQFILEEVTNGTFDTSIKTTALLN